jgi:hypothetical protein
LPWARSLLLRKLRRCHAALAYGYTVTDRYHAIIGAAATGSDAGAGTILVGVQPSLMRPAMLALIIGAIASVCQRGDERRASGWADDEGSVHGHEGSLSEDGR